MKLSNAVSPPLAFLWVGGCLIILEGYIVLNFIIKHKTHVLTVVLASGAVFIYVQVSLKHCFHLVQTRSDLYIATLRQNVCHSVLGGVLRLKFVETRTVILSPLLKKRLFNCTFCFVLFVDSLVACKITKGYFQ